MTDFDDRFADRVREVFDTYEEPIDPAALERMRAALGRGAAGRALDRPPAPRSSGRWRKAAWIGLPVALLAASLWLRVSTDTPPEPSVSAATTPSTGEGPSDSGSDTGPADASPPPPTADARAVTAPQRRVPRITPALAWRPGTEPPTSPPPAGATTPPTIQREPVDEPLPQDAPTSDLAGRPPVASVFASGAPSDLPLAWTEPTSSAETGRSAVRVVVATATTFSDGRAAEGVGISAGLVREWRVTRRLALSGGAAVAYNRFTVEPDGPTAAMALSALDEDPTVAVSVPSLSRVRTLAFEVPLDVTVDVARTAVGRVGLSVGLTSALYLTQTFDDQGQVYAGQYVADPSGDVGTLFVVSNTAFDTQETARALSRLDVGRQLNLGVRLSGDRGTVPFAADLYARLPLGGLTSRDLALTTLGLRLRYALP